MGYRSDVKILMANKAYDLLYSTCIKNANQSIREMVTLADKIEKEEDCVFIEWTDVKWYQSYDDIGAVNKVLRHLDSIVEKDHSLIKDYYYKIIGIGEDNATWEETNDNDYMHTNDFFVECTFSL